MAKIRLRFGTNEVEIDSRDFYIDNDTAAQVIADLAFRLQENSAKLVTEESALETPGIAETYQANLNYLNMLRDAEVHEPEFTAPSPVTPEELPGKIEDLEDNGFFSKPRTVSETVGTVASTRMDCKSSCSIKDSCKDGIPQGTC